MEQQSKKGLAIAGLVFGICALASSWSGYVGIICGIVGLILSIIAMKSYKDLGQKSGMATAGLVLSIIGLVLSIILLVTCVCATKAIADNPDAFVSALDELSSGVQ